MAFYVYIMASKPRGTLYIGSTESLSVRVGQHRDKVRPNGFTARYDVTLLVWFEVFSSREGAKIRERQMKEWKRAWKIRLIEEANPDWRDLSDLLY
jgi:putative endonuclease